MMLLIRNFLQNEFRLVAFTALEFANLVIFFHLIGFIILYKMILSIYNYIYIYNSFKN